MFIVFTGETFNRLRRMLFGANEEIHDVDDIYSQNPKLTAFQDHAIALGLATEPLCSQMNVIIGDLEDL